MTNLEKYKEEIEERFEIYEMDLDGNELGHWYEFARNKFETLDNLVKWLLDEYKGKVLDDKEKEYLENVLRPFKNQVKYICKHSYKSLKKEYLYIKFEVEDEHTLLPSFEIQTMYKGMESFKNYTLKELGLFEVGE